MSFCFVILFLLYLGGAKLDQYFAIEFMSGLYVQSLHISSVKLNANRLVIGTLRGFDQFMNLVINNTVDVSGNYNTHNGMVVSFLLLKVILNFSHVYLWSSSFKWCFEMLKNTNFKACLLIHIICWHPTIICSLLGEIVLSWSRHWS
jgi:small nuclear ribonucleoprotein (snRNP)-like protein